MTIACLNLTVQVIDLSRAYCSPRWLWIYIYLSLITFPTSSPPSFSHSTPHRLLLSHHPCVFQSTSFHLYHRLFSAVAGLHCDTLSPHRSSLRLQWHLPESPALSPARTALPCTPWTQASANPFSASYATKDMARELRSHTISNPTPPARTSSLLSLIPAAGKKRPPQTIHRAHEKSIQ